MCVCVWSWLHTYTCMFDSVDRCVCESVCQPALIGKSLPSWYQMLQWFYLLFTHRALFIDFSWGSTQIILLLPQRQQLLPLKWLYGINYDSLVSTLSFFVCYVKNVASGAVMRSGCVCMPQDILVIRIGASWRKGFWNSFCPPHSVPC